MDEHSPNAMYYKWREILPLLDGYLDVADMLTVSHVCHSMYEYRWTLQRQKLNGTSKDRVLVFSAFRGYDPTAILAVTKHIIKKLHPATRNEGVCLDFSQCVLLRDSHLASLFEEGSLFVPKPSPEHKHVYTRLLGLRLNFCTHLTDKSFTVLLNAYLPHLSELSCKGICNENFTGEPFKSNFSRTMWPKIQTLHFEFSSITLGSAVILHRILSGAVGGEYDDDYFVSPSVSSFPTVASIQSGQKSVGEGAGRAPIGLNIDLKPSDTPTNAAVNQSSCERGYSSELALGNCDPWSQSQTVEFSKQIKIPTSLTGEIAPILNPHGHPQFKQPDTLEITHNSPLFSNSLMENEYDVHIDDVSLPIAHPPIHGSLQALIGRTCNDRQESLNLPNRGIHSQTSSRHDCEGSARQSTGSISVSRIIPERDLGATDTPPHVENESPGRTSQLYSTLQSYEPVPTVGEQVILSFYGTIASRQLFSALGLGDYRKGFEDALVDRNAAKVRELARTVSYPTNSPENSAGLESQHSRTHLCNLYMDVVASSFSVYIANIPVKRAASECGGKNVWTLPIIIAVEQGSDLVESLIECGAVIDTTDYLGKSVIYRAVANRNYAATEALLRHQVCLHPLNIEQQQSMNVVIQHSDFDLMSLLLKHDYPLTIKAHGVTSYKGPLFYACELGNEQATHLLLDWGADPNEYHGTYKNSAIMLAYKSSIRLLYVFLHSSKFHSINLASEVLTCAIAKNDLETIEVMISMFPILVVKSHPVWNVPHVHAARTGRVQILEYFLNTITTIIFPGNEQTNRVFPVCVKHAPVPWQNKYHEFATPNESQLPIDTLGTSYGPNILTRAPSLEKKDFRLSPLFAENDMNLMAMAVNSNSVLTQFLHHVDPITKNTALHFAAEANHLDCVKLLLRFGCRVGLTNAAGDTPLHLSCSEDRYEIAAYLLCCGSDALDTRNMLGENALMTAIRCRNDKCAQVILQFYSFCAQSSMIFPQGDTYSTTNDLAGPLDYAIKYHRWEVIAHILSVDRITLFITGDPNKRLEAYNAVATILENNTVPEQYSPILKWCLTWLNSLIYGVEVEEICYPYSPSNEGSISWEYLCLVCRTTDSFEKKESLTEPKGSRLKKFHLRLKTAAKRGFIMFGSRT